MKSFPMMSDSYDDGRLVEQSPLVFRAARLARYVEFHITAIFPLGSSRPELVESFIKRFWLFPGEHDSLLQQPQSDLELSLKELMPFMEELVTAQELAYDEADHRLFIATVEEMLSTFLVVRGKTDHLRLLLEEHHWLVSGIVHKGLFTTSSLHRFVEEPTPLFHELARLRDELFDDWSSEGLEIYLMVADELTVHENYNSWRNYAKTNIQQEGVDFPSLERLPELRAELEVRQLWKVYAE